MRGGPERGPSDEQLARALRRAADARSPVAVVELHAHGRQLEPSRGTPGAMYQPHEISVRYLAEGSSAFDGGLVLYPPPDPDVRRVIVLPLDDANWLPYDAALERTVAKLTDQRGTRER